MKQKIFCCLTITLLSMRVFGQTTTINYSSASLGSNCNVFSPSVSVNNVVHQSLASGVSFTSGTGILLPTVPSGPTAGGTAYVIQYNFASGSTYTITITAKGDNAVYLKATVVSNLTQFNSASANSCTPDAYVTGYNSTVGVGGMSVQPSNSFTVYTNSSFSGSGQQNLVVWATGGPSNLNSDAVLISKIEITKTTNAPSFTLPPSTNINCGSTSPITFTVNTASNPNNLTITDYTWNLGVNNGWLYNGSAASSTISTGTNSSITLTPVCGTTHSNISATVTAGGNTYNASGGAINVTAPTLSIVGDGTICSGTATYSIDNLPCDASVTWSASPSGIVSLSCTSCSGTTLTKIGSGTVTLTATITTSCSVQSPISKTIAVGAPDYQFQVYSSSSPDCYLTNEYYDFYVMPTTEQQQSIERYIWGYRDLSTNVAKVVNYDGVSGEAILFPYEGMFEVFVQAENSCGDGQESVYNFVTAVESCPGFAFNASVAPNPLQNDAFVTITDQSRDVKALPANTDVIMDLYQVNSTQKLKQWRFKNDRNKYQINVSGLHRGMYTLVITIGKYKRAKQLLVTE